MRITRSLATVVAAVALTTGLLAGGASAAQADTHIVHYPTCTQALHPVMFETGNLMDGWILYHPRTTSSIRYGSSNTAIVAMIKSHPNRSCTWYPGKFEQAATLSEVQLNSAQLRTLRAYYLRNGVVGESEGGPALNYTYESPTHPGWLSRDTIFPNGTVVFTLDRSGRINGAFNQDAVDVVIGLNPWINT